MASLSRLMLHEDQQELKRQSSPLSLLTFKENLFIENVAVRQKIITSFNF